MDVIERANIKALLVRLDTKRLQDLCGTLRINIQGLQQSIESIAEKVLAEIDKKTITKDSVMRLGGYLAIAPKIEHRTRGLTKLNLWAILKRSGEPPENISRDSILLELRERIASGQLELSEINNQKIIFLKNVVEKVKNPQTRAYIASKLLGGKVEEYTSKDLVNLVIEKVQSAIITDDDVLELIKTARKETALAGKRSIQAPTLQRMDQRIDEIARDVKEIRQSLNRLEELKLTGIVRSYRSGSGKDLGRSLEKIRLAYSRVNDRNEKRYDKLLDSLKNEGFTLEALLDQVGIIETLDILDKLILSIGVSIPIEDFHQAMKEEIKTHQFSSRPTIHAVRELLTKRLRITNEEFNNCLVECRARGLVRLIEGSPYSENKEDWLDMDGKRYYYIEVVEGK